MRVPERLQPLVEDGVVQQVVQPLMSGKEASLFVVLANGEYCVAKVYKDAQHRSFRHRAGYAEGRKVRNSRQRRAMEKGSRYGKRQLEEAWQNAEVDALFRLSEAGIRVPRPHQYVDGVLLMDLILDPDGDPAPRLFDVDLTPEDARDLHAFLVRQVVEMLCAGLVHGDLSECNVLLAWDGPVIIDLPQATDAAHNPNAMTLFVRDVDNLTRYLARFAPELAETRYGNEIWNLYQRGELFPDTPLTGRWAGSNRRANVRAVLNEIDDAAREAMRMREANGDRRPLQGRRAAAVQPEPPPRRHGGGRGPKGQGSRSEGQGPSRGQPPRAPARDSAPNDAGARDAASSDPARREPARRDGGQRESTRRDAGPREPTRRDAGPRDAAPRDTARRDAGPRDAAPRDPARRDAGPRDAGPRDAGPRDPGPRDPGSKAPPQSARPRQPGSKEASAGSKSTPAHARPRSASPPARPPEADLDDLDALLVAEPAPDRRRR